MSSVISLNNIAPSLHILFILFNFLSIHFSNDFFLLTTPSTPNLVELSKLVLFLFKTTNNVHVIYLM
jgi:hypothetical protein